MRLAVGEDSVSLTHARAARADDFARAMPLVFHYCGNCDVESLFFNNFFCRFLMRRTAVYYDDFRERPLWVPEPPRENFSERSDIVIFLHTLDAKRTVLTLDWRTILDNRHHANRIRP